MTANERRPVAVSDSPAHLLLLVPMAIERAAVGSLPAAAILPTGMGRCHAVAAAAKARIRPAGAVAVAGYCGALTGDLRPGDVVVATGLSVDGQDGCHGKWPACSAGPLVAALRAHGVERIQLGRIVSSGRLVHGRDRERLAAGGAVAVDMESAWLSEAAAARPFAVLRVVLDAPGSVRRPVAALRGAQAARRSLRRAAPALADWAAAAGERTVLLASPRSFCAGARRAIEVVERALDLYGAPVFVRKQIVHNTHVVHELEKRGAVFVDGIDEIDPGSLCIFSAHGVAPDVREEAAAKKLRVIDATCPLVAKVHAEARRFAGSGHHIVLIGHPGHDEVEGTIGEARASISVVDRADQVDDLVVPDPGKVAYLTQTTLALDEVSEIVERLQRKFPHVVGPRSNDICYATSNRQEAVRAVAHDADLVLVIGSSNSSNSCRLVEISEREGCPAKLVEDDTSIDPVWLRHVRTVGVTAGASASQALVDRVLRALGSLGPINVEERQVVTESLKFTLPAQLRDVARPGASSLADSIVARTYDAEPLPVEAAPVADEPEV